MLNQQWRIPVVREITLHQQFVAVLWLGLVLVLLSGCAVSPQQTVASKPVDASQITIEKSLEQESPDAKGWWQIGFHRQYQSDDEVQWQYDTFLALKVFKPVIDSTDDIELWRFHRRAVSDNSGHKFSFIFYATRSTAEQVYQSVANLPLVKQLLTGSHIARLSFYDINLPLRKELSDTSDSHWPVELQAAWPHFIMGVSQTWLSLVDNYYQQLEVEAEEDSGLDDQLVTFEQLNEKLNTLWKNYGSHAFLHHLNALFAYQELYIIEKRVGRF